jgi:hypothetical protein
MNKDKTGQMNKCKECQFEDGHSQECSRYMKKDWGKTEQIRDLRKEFEEFAKPLDWADAMIYSEWWLQKLDEQKQEMADMLVRKSVELNMGGIQTRIVNLDTVLSLIKEK